MSVRALLRLLGGYAIVLFVACFLVRARATLSAVAPGEQRIVSTVWRDGHRVQRRAHSAGEPALPVPLSADTLVDEVGVAEAPLSLSSLTFPYALVPGRDGVRVELDGRNAWATVDDLLHAQAYDHAHTLFDPSFGVGTNEAAVLLLLADELGVTPADVQARGRATRVRFERHLATAQPVTGPPEHLERAAVLAAVIDAARFLARGVDPSGRFRYLVDPITDRTLAGYNWPRHAGTTYFLAQVPTDDPEIRAACLRAAALLRDERMGDCGEHRCIVDGNEADVGSAALSLVAFAEIVRNGIDTSYLPAVKQLAAFLRSQQRPDGELMHLYDRAARHPIDRQLPYYTGEAALGLSRAHRVTHDEQDRVAASRALARLRGKAWSFFGDRYFFNEEHWTCQAVADLWDRAPDQAALDFCLRWHEWQRRLQFDDRYSPSDDTRGGFGVGPFVTPRTTPASARGEAAAAALSVVRHDPALAAELDAALGFVLREQLRPGSRHLFTHPSLTQGAIPASAVDLQLRNDYTQHAGSMMVRWLELNAAP